MDSKDMMDNMMGMAMGLSMASVFTRVMERTMENSITPNTNRGAYENLLAQGQRYIYAVVDGRSCGPLSLQELTSMIRDGRVTAETYIWKAGMPDWLKAKDVTDIAPIVNVPPVFKK